MRAFVSGRAGWGVVVAATVAVCAEWLRSPAMWIALVVAILVVMALTQLRGDRSPLVWTARGALVLLGLLTGWESWQLGRIVDDWPARREAIVTRASERLGAELDQATRLVGEVAAGATAACDLTREAAFPLVDQVRGGRGSIIAVAILQPTGAPWVWAGRHFAVPAPEGDSLGVQGSSTHLALQVRRPCGHDRTVVATTLIRAAPSEPMAASALVERFRAETDVAVQVWPGDLAPDEPDVFDYQFDTPQGTRTLFSLQAIPPDQGARWTLVAERAGVRVVLLVVLLLGAACVLVPPGGSRALLLVVTSWFAARVPLARIFDSDSLWSQATFFRDFLGPFSASAGALLVAGAAATILAAAFWERGSRRRPLGLAVAAILTLAAPYLVSSLARGITPPADGVPLGLWLTWEFALVAAAGACVAVASALVRGTEVSTRVPWSWWLGVGAAIAGAWLGLSVWSPRGGWPDWYPLPWAAALILLLWRPAPRWATIVGLGIVAGSAASLLTWGAELEGRLQVARRDIQRLGAELDPLAVPRISRLAALADSTPPAGAADLYELWRVSPSGGDDYPALLALWDRDGRERTELLLDSVDVPPPLIAALIRELPETTTTRITALARVPGMHLVMLHRLADARILVAVLGPRTQLIPPATLSRLLEVPARGAPLYDLVLGTPDPDAATEGGVFRWEREGWGVSGDRHLELPGGVRHVHAHVDLGSPGRLLVRGTLVLAADAAFLALLWFLGGALAGAVGPRPRWRRLGRSYRVRLAVALATFFVIPALSFAAWTFARTREDAGRRRDLLLAQTLRGAQPFAVTLSTSADADAGLRDLSRGTGAEYGLYRGGRLVGVSHPVLADLGVLPALLPAPAYTTLVLGDALERMVDVRGADGRTLRMGYRLIRPGGPAEAGVLAAPRLSDDTGMAREQEDLALLVLLAALLGTAAAFGAAQFASRALARPVRDLRAAALAIGRGEALPERPGEPPAEFEPVFAGFTRMAADIATGRAALEEARRRTDAVLATVATGVVAVDPAGRILLANARAHRWLGAALAEGSELAAVLPPSWEGVAVAVRRALAGGGMSSVEVESEGRRYVVELATLGDDPGGLVLALADLTDASHAARVVAWGEMARQIAHEIKNPLTPLRLGLQHLQRVREERPAEFDRTFDETSARILSEIDRLDTVARAFSRFALPADEAPPLERVDLAATAEEALALYRLGEGEGSVALERAGPAVVPARRDELKEVLMNLVENARNAGATKVRVRVGGGTLEVSDDGRGIPEGDLKRIFEPHFSTTTSGAGLGLSIVKRLVESWGATIVASNGGKGGATVTVRWPAP
jgi:two-component system nitrogen regulation sensor histidine kinase NtrY